MRRIVCTLGLMAAGVVALASEPPADAAVAERGATRPGVTLAPKVIVNSGRLDWEPHARDLSAWPTLSYKDKRSAVPPQRVTLAEPLNGDPKRGKALAFDREKGYCGICHELPEDPWPGNFGISLRKFKLHRYRDVDVYQHIYDARINNPHTAMPPYGSHKILSEQDIRDLTAYLQSLD